MSKRKRVGKAEAKAGVRGSNGRYTAEFRREALAMLEAGKTLTAVCDELGVAMGTLQAWRLKADANTLRGVEPGARGESLISENERLKRELKAAKIDLQIAKKAAAFFAKHSS
jgi:transposase